MRSRRSFFLLPANLAIFQLTRSARAEGTSEPYRVALPNYRFEFPRDHFNHPDFRTEWWYYTGNLRTPEERRFGFELTFFRQALDRNSLERKPVAESVWDVRDIWMAHLALSDIGGKQFLHTERLNRSGAGIAGADFQQARIWNGNWQAQWKLDPSIPGGGLQTLTAVADRFSFELSLKSTKPPVIHGENGVSQKAEGAGKASHYISFTRLNTKGEIVLDGKRFVVDGTTWMDHEFFSHQLEADQSGWDWFSLQMDDRSEIMLFRLRRAGGAADPYSAGTYVDPQGRATHLAVKDFKVTAATGGHYPVEWTVEIPSLNFHAVLRTPLEQQELTGSARSGGTYWEGAIDVDATRFGRKVTGVGYLEMTGYAGRIAGLD
jgi:predicted secreted hydrolase